MEDNNEARKRPTKNSAKCALRFAVCPISTKFTVTPWYWGVLNGFVWFVRQTRFCLRTENGELVQGVGYEPTNSYETGS